MVQVSNIFEMPENTMLIISIIALLILVCSTINIYIYYRDVKEIQELTKEKLRLEIQVLKNK